MKDAYFCALFNCIAKHARSKTRGSGIIAIAILYMKSHICQQEMQKALRVLATKEEICAGLREFQTVVNTHTQPCTHESEHSSFRMSDL